MGWAGLDALLSKEGLRFEYLTSGQSQADGLGGLNKRAESRFRGRLALVVIFCDARRGKVARIQCCRAENEMKIT